VRRLSTTLKAKRELVRTVSATQTATERQAILLRFRLTESRVTEFAAVIARNDARPAEQRAPLTAKRLQGGGRKRVLTDEQEKQVERSATARYGLMHLPNAAWSNVLSYFSGARDVREDWWFMFKQSRLRYTAWQKFTFPETKKRTQKAAVAAAAAAAPAAALPTASAPAPAVSMQPQSLPLRLHPMMQPMPR
jgi:hypothetical protein